MTLDALITALSTLDLPGLTVSGPPMRRGCSYATLSCVLCGVCGGTGGGCGSGVTEGAGSSRSRCKWVAGFPVDTKSPLPPPILTSFQPPMVLNTLINCG
jgi:hypothetical protein